MKIVDRKTTNSRSQFAGNRLAAAIRRHSRLRTMVAQLARLIPRRLRENLWQWLLRDVHEAEFRLFERVCDARGLLLDIGANRGHAAISVLRHTHHFRVVSLEPNPALRWSLLLIRCLHPFRFRFRVLAAGEYSGFGQLVVPVGDTDLSTQATLDPDEFEKPYVQERLAQQGHQGPNGRFSKAAVRICPADELGLVPDVVKIDVEGWEAQTLQGMATMLTTAMPLMIIEINNIERWAPGLEALGYRFYTLEENQLLPHDSWRGIRGLNVICAHPRTPSEVARSLIAPLDRGR